MFIILLLFFIASLVEAVENEDHACDKLSGGTFYKWSCTDVPECPWAEQMLEYNKAVYCSADKAKKICCPPHSNPTSTNTPQPMQGSEMPIKYNSPSALMFGRNDPAKIVQRKCADYRIHRYVNVTRSLFINTKPTQLFELDCKYGDTLIVGGEEVLTKELPHMAILGYKNLPIKNIEWACGGTLISEQFILTAAHCTQTAYGPVKWVALGLLERNQILQAKLHENIFRVAQIINHPEYKAPLQDNDIALLKLDSRVKFSPFMRPICLHTSRENPRHVKNITLISGWGRTHASESNSEQLLKAKVKFIPETECITAFRGAQLKNGYDPKTMVCAGDKTLGKDTCEGDSGGPLQVHDDGYQCMWSQVGVTSLGSSYCGDKTPAVYTKVSYYISWIQKTVWP